MIWEAAMAAAHYRAGQPHCPAGPQRSADRRVRTTRSWASGDISAKFAAFGFECFEVDGHDIEAIAAAAAAPRGGKPKFIRCRTVKGKGVSFMEGNAGWHGKPMNAEEYETAMKELGGTDRCLKQNPCA
ncbi:MAG: hypothetical protein M0C28_30350 [Candidatus Moduliflexus flocculans]|nr:hypothetical protein [Candidatus Moduliflexus flocculans]